MATAMGAKETALKFVVEPAVTMDHLHARYSSGQLSAIGETPGISHLHETLTQYFSGAEARTNE